MVNCCYKLCLVNDFSLPIISDIPLLFEKTGFYPAQTGFYPIQTGFYPAQTGFIRYSFIITDCAVNITVISYFSYSRTKVPRRRRTTTTTTTYTFLWPRCFATRGQKIIIIIFRCIHPGIYYILLVFMSCNNIKLSC